MMYKNTNEPKTKIAKLRLAGRIVVGLFISLAVFGCSQVSQVGDESGANYLRVPFVRVLLDEAASSVTVNSKNSFAIECLAGKEQTVYYSSTPVTAEIRGGRVAVRNSKGNLIRNNLDEVNFYPKGNNSLLQIGKSNYRGLIKVLASGKNAQVINVLYMEDYLRGVVPPEIGERNLNELEAVKAQAIAARTYAMAHLGQYQNQQYDMKSSIIDQVYYGYDIEDRLVNKAINETTGEVLFYQDNFVNAYYHSTCGGMTDNIDHVWDRKEVPYLKAVSDSGACSWSKYYTWKEFFTESQLRGRIEQYLASDRGRDFKINRIKDLEIVGRTPGDRVEELLVKTDKDVFSFKKDRIRWVIGRTSNPDLILPSDRFRMDIERDGAGYVSAVTFIGRGYGHGIGMCQCGAIGLSRLGWKCEDILGHYYTNVEVKDLY